jgi:hypothetical protein
MFLVPVWIYLLQTSLDSFSKFQSLHVLVTNIVLFKILTGDDNIASGFNSSDNSVGVETENRDRGTLGYRRGLQPVLEWRPKKGRTQYLDEEYKKYL